MKKITSIIYLSGILTIASGFSVQAKSTSIGYDRECHPSNKWKKVKSYQFVTENKSYSIVQSFERVDSVPNLTGLSLCLVRGDKPKVLKVSTNNNTEPNFTEYGYRFKNANQGLLKKIKNAIFEIHILYESDSMTLKKYRLDLRDPEEIKVKVLSHFNG